MSQKHIVVLGEVCTDIYHYVKLSDTPNPEDPSVPLFKVVRSEFKEGMALNVKNALEKLGNKVTLITDVLKPEIEKIRLVDVDTNKVLERVDIDSYYSTKIILSRSDIKALENCDAVIVCDYGKHFLSPEFGGSPYYLNKINMHVNKNVPIFIDPYKTRTSLDFYLKILSDFKVTFSPNRTEAKALFGDKLEQSIKEEMCAVVANNKNVNFLYKKSESGLSYYTLGHEVNQNALTSPGEVVDVCGAGDILLAAFVNATLKKQTSLYSDLMYANAAAAVSVQHLGNYCPSKEEIQEVLDAARQK